MNIKKTLKNNKYSCIAIGIFVVVIIVGFLLYKLLFPNTGTPIYGNRLDGINDVNYTKDSLNVIAEKIKEEKVVNAEINENGKIINVIVTVSEKPKKEDATKFAKIILDNSTKEQINYFDYQLFVKSEKEDYKEKKPVIIPIIIYIGNEKWNIQHNNRIRYTSFEENNMELGYNILDFNLYKTKEIKSKKSKINKYILLKKEMKIYLIDEKYNL